MTVVNANDDRADLKCSVCGRPGDWFTPFGGAPYTDVLCRRHALRTNLSLPGTYVSLLFVGAILYGTWRVVRFLGDLVLGF